MVLYYVMKGILEEFEGDKFEVMIEFIGFWRENDVG